MQQPSAQLGVEATARLASKFQQALFFASTRLQNTESHAIYIEGTMLMSVWFLDPLLQEIHLLVTKPQ